MWRSPVACSLWPGVSKPCSTGAADRPGAADRTGAADRPGAADRTGAAARPAQRTGREQRTGPGQRSRTCTCSRSCCRWRPAGCAPPDAGLRPGGRRHPTGQPGLGAARQPGTADPAADRPGPAAPTVGTWTGWKRACSCCARPPPGPAWPGWPRPGGGRARTCATAPGCATTSGAVWAATGTPQAPAGWARVAAAVVDPELRVHGLAGLRVADASVMPTIPNAHPNATVLAIAERAADLIQPGDPAGRARS